MAGGLRAMVVAAMVVVVLASSGCGMVSGSADESLAKLDSQLAAVEKDLEKVATTLDEIEPFFPETDLELECSQADRSLMTAEQGAQLAETFGRSSEATAARLESGMRGAEKTLADCPRTLLSSAQRDRLASQEKRVKLMRSAVNVAKDASASLPHLRLVPALATTLRENDAACASVMSQIAEALVAMREDRPGVGSMTAAVCKTGKERLAPSVSLTRSAVKRFSSQTEYNEESGCSERLNAQGRLCDHLALFEKEVIAFRDDPGPVNDAWGQVLNDCTELENMRYGRPSHCLRNWYGASFGEQGEQIRDRIEESRKLAEEAEG